MGFLGDIVREIGAGVRRAALFFAGSVVAGAVAGAIWGALGAAGATIGAVLGAVAGAVAGGALIWLFVSEA